MKIDFEVHNVTQQPRNVVATVNGEQLPAVTTCTEVELTAVDKSHGSLVLRFVGAAATEAKETFITGKIVTFSV